MSLDHYVSQVHLKNFYSPKLGKRMHALRKSTLIYYPCDAYSQCRRKDGSTTKFLKDPRAVEQFLKSVEPYYNPCTDIIHSGDVDSNSVYVITGFVVYVLTCSPTALRNRSAVLRAMVESTAKQLDEDGEFGTPPDSLGANSLTELLDKKIVYLKIDEEYPQAMGVSNIFPLIQRLGNSGWTILRNDHDDLRFVTSDYPVALLPSSDPRVMDKLVPLRPDLAIIIHPDHGTNQNYNVQKPLSFSNFRYGIKDISRREAKYFNTQIIRAAEDAVYFKNDSPALRRCIANNRNYKTGVRVDTMRVDDEYIQINRERIVSFDQDARGENTNVR